MTPTEALVERVSERLFALKRPHLKWAAVPEKFRASWKEETVDTLRALASLDDFQLVPKVATEGMIEVAYNIFRPLSADERLALNLAKARDAHTFKMVRRWNAMLAHPDADLLKGFRSG